MTAAGRGARGDLPGWIAGELAPALADATTIGDVAGVRALLIEAARERRTISYSELLGALGHRFTRPKMRALCRTLDAVDRVGEAAGEPPLAALVVRESDRLPGQGWWTSVVHAASYDGPWSGAAAVTFVAMRQGTAFDYWSTLDGEKDAGSGGGESQASL